MSVLDDGQAFLKNIFGLVTNRAAANLPQTAQTPYFTVSGGQVIIMAIIGTVTTAIQAQATTVQLIATPGSGTAVNISNATGDINGKEVGSTITTAATLGGTLSVANAGANILPTSSGFIVRTGTIDFKTGASSTGQTSWQVFWLPITKGAQVVAA